MEYFSKEVLAGLEAARKRDARRKSRLRVQVGDALYPVLRLWDRGFALDADSAPHLRGLVDLYDGSRHLMQCLIVASTEEAGEIVCEFKWTTGANGAPPADFVKDEDAPVGYLPPA
ncbi:MAG: hypothetical protein KGK00_10005 [Paracoccaceae bacterium]|nr:hypothetical protein [Paracoccaceae bacterium]MDE3238722.1 hypothetical protein [Paracoccaceae bacterium]